MTRRCGPERVYFSARGYLANEISKLVGNGALPNETPAGLRRFDTLLFPNKTSHLMGGIVGRGLHSRGPKGSGGPLEKKLRVC
ncbi:hypothetical protein DIPPA_09421 [Diplonema papillatum]|nr:hypothetical protein DIPPA_09421 [Diplonema papillatum]